MRQASARWAGLWVRAADSLLYIIGRRVNSPFHFVFGRPLPILRRAGVCAALAVVALILCSGARGAEQEPADSIGRVIGGDVSVNGQMLASPLTATPVLSGNEVTVHSGQALLRLTSGGNVSICGPAKLTALESDGQVTLALEFGRMHVELPTGAAVRVLTPSIVATPIEIQGGKRDLTVGLDQNNLLCVIAARGAVQLEQEFSGEKLVVPESGDFSLAAGQLVPVSGGGAVCRCDAYPDAAPAATPRYPAPQVTVLAPQPSDVAPPSATPSAPKPPAPKPAEDAPKVSEIILPPLAFSSPMTAPPEVPTEATVALLRELHAEPDWSFTGRVETPEFAKAMTKALGVKPPTPTADPPPAGAALPQQKKKRGFWGKLKTIFVGDEPH
jgi:hypothetical protein